MIDRLSDTWTHVAKWANNELLNATERIETLGVGQDETENLRGRIAVLRELVAMQKSPEQWVVEKVDDYGFQGPETD